MRAYFVLLIGALISGCQTAPEPNQKFKQRYDLTEADKSAILSALRREVRDPSSVIAGDYNAGFDEKGVASVCGWVNAKNGFGGYTGNVPYSGVLATNVRGERVFAVTGLAGTPNETKALAILIMCQREGLPLR